VERLFFIPQFYNPEDEISEPIEYEIIGIYKALEVESGTYSITNNYVIIPDKSFEGIGDTMDVIYGVDNIPPIMSDGMIVPNGKIDEAREAIDGFMEGYAGLMRFFDQGYPNILRSLLNLRMGMTWILTFAFMGWIVAVSMFLLFYVGRKRNEAATLYHIGVSAGKRFAWVFSQCALIVIIAQAAALIVGLEMYGEILQTAEVFTEEFTEGFRDYVLSDGQGAGIRSYMPINRSPLAFVIMTIGGTALMLVAAGLMAKRAITFRSLIAGKGVAE
jgi:hypothetical protein